MELWLSLAMGGGRTAPDVEVRAEVDPSHRGADLIEALAAAGVVPAERRGPWWVERTGRRLDPDADLGSADLRTGDRLVHHAVGPPPAPPAPLTLVVASGPGVGLRVPLHEGRWTLGRGADVDVPVDDAGLSRHHLTIEVTGEQVMLQDAGSANGTHVGGKLATGPVPVESGVPVEAGRTVLRIERAAQGPVRMVTRHGVGAFNRPPRRATPVTRIQVTLPDPPVPAPPRRIPLASALVPVLLAPVLMVVGGSAVYLAFAAMSPLMVLASYWEERRHGGHDRKDQLSRFEQAVTEAAAHLRAGLPVEAVARWAESPDPAEVVARAVEPRSSLWERRPGDDDFLVLRVGWADLPSRSTVSIPSEGDRTHLERARTRLAPFDTVAAVPVRVDLREAGAVGLVGPGPEVVASGRWLLTQLAVLHSPRDLVIGAVVARAPDWDWVDRLPHAAGSAGGGLAVGAAAGLRALAALDELVTARSAGARLGLGGPAAPRAAAGPAVVVVLDEGLDIPRSAVATVLEEGPVVGVHVVWLGTVAEALPGACGAVVSTGSTTVDVLWPATGRELHRAGVDIIPPAATDAVAWSLCGMRDTSSRDEAGELPASLGIGDLLGLDEPAAAAIGQRWHHDRDRGGLRAPLGHSARGPFAVDLRHDGPHVLLGGTTGAGKSELLQTFVVALAACHPPERVAFLLVDYKGGAAFKDCRWLPHTVGLVTDLDGHLVHRALRSLNAELTRRERVLAEVGAKDLPEMERLAPDRAPPSLLLVVDEFATLANELPEFVDGVVNVAQRGRSLGIHLVLATQRPAGAINDNIRANTNLRISLRMNDAADSEDVVGTAAAAALPRSIPGRALVRTGAGEVTAVQVAYSGGRSTGADDQGVGPIRLRVRGANGFLAVAPPGPEPVDPGPGDPDGESDLQALVGAIREAAEAAGSRLAPSPWLPPLPELIDLAEVTGAAETGGSDPSAGGRPPSALAVGRRDDPDGQAQHRHTFDLEADGSLLVVGATGSGKTTLLRTIAASFAITRTPAEGHLYALDFASRGLGSLAGLPHCGAVVVGADQERVVRLLSTIDAWMAERRDLLGAAGATTLRELASHGPVPPRILVLVDGLAGYVQDLERVEFGTWVDRLPQLVTEGTPLGIHWVLTADRRTVLPLALASAVASRLVLRVADPDDYGSLGLDQRAVAQGDLPPGRGYDGATREVQVAVLGGQGPGEAQVRAMTALGHDLAARHPGAGAPAIRVLPSEVALEEVPEVGERWKVSIGLEADALGPAVLDLSDGHGLVVGPVRSGRSVALAAATRGARRVVPGLRTVLLVPRRSPLVELDGWDAVHQGVDAIEDAVESLEEQLRTDPERPVLVVVDDLEELVDGGADAGLERLARRGRDGELRIVAACERSAAHRAYDGLAAEVRRGRHGLILQPDADADGDLFGVVLPRGVGGGPVGRGVLVDAGRVQRVQVAR